IIRALGLALEPHPVEPVAATRSAKEERPAVRLVLLVRGAKHRPDAHGPRGLAPLAGLITDHSVETFRDQRVRRVSRLNPDGRAVAELKAQLGLVLAQDDLVGDE